MEQYTRLLFLALVVLVCFNVFSSAQKLKPKFTKPSGSFSTSDSQQQTNNGLKLQFAFKAGLNQKISIAFDDIDLSVENYNYIEIRDGKPPNVKTEEIYYVVNEKIYVKNMKSNTVDIKILNEMPTRFDSTTNRVRLTYNTKNQDKTKGMNGKYEFYYAASTCDKATLADLKPGSPAMTCNMKVSPYANNCTGNFDVSCPANFEPTRLAYCMAASVYDEASDDVIRDQKWIYCKPTEEIKAVCFTRKDDSGEMDIDLDACPVDVMEWVFELGVGNFNADGGESLGRSVLSACDRGFDAICYNKNVKNKVKRNMKNPKYSIMCDEGVTRGSVCPKTIKKLTTTVKWIFQKFNLLQNKVYINFRRLCNSCLLSRRIKQTPNSIKIFS